jgi:hypothetical protein
MEKETLEEAAEMNCVCKTKDCVHYKSFISGVKSDATRDYWFEKFKAERYSEEEVEELLNKRSFDLIHKRDTKTTNEWFEKYKKK